MIGGHSRTARRIAGVGTLHRILKVASAVEKQLDLPFRENRIFE